MVTNARAGHAPVALRRSERVVVAVLARLLPGEFRARQRAEWTGDLLALADGGASPRWRYLLGAAWTLPALRALVRQRQANSPSGGVIGAGASAVLARVLLVGLGWPVISWLVAVPVRYVLLDVPGRLARQGEVPFDPKDLWPTDGPLVLLVPLWYLLTLGAWVAVLGGPFLVGTVGLAGAVLGPVQRSRGGTYRLTAGLLGVATATAALVYTGLVGIDLDEGVTAGVLGCAAVILGLAARGLTRRIRVALVLVGLGASALLVAHHVPVGAAMLTWYLD